MAIITTISNCQIFVQYDVTFKLTGAFNKPQTYNYGVAGGSTFRLVVLVRQWRACLILLENSEKSPKNFYVKKKKDLFWVCESEQTNYYMARIMIRYSSKNVIIIEITFACHYYQTIQKRSLPLIFLSSGILCCCNSRDHLIILAM